MDAHQDPRPANPHTDARNTGPEPEMMHNENHTPIEPEDDPRLTAYALGELDEPAVISAVEATLAADARARAFVDEVRATAARLTEDFAVEARAGDADLALLPTQRAAIEQALSGPASSENVTTTARPGAPPLPRVLRWMPAAAAVTAAIGLGAWTAQQSWTQGVDGEETLVATAPSATSPGGGKRSADPAGGVPWATESLDPRRSGDLLQFDSLTRQPNARQAPGAAYVIAGSTPAPSVTLFDQGSGQPVVTGSSRTYGLEAMAGLVSESSTPPNPNPNAAGSPSAGFSYTVPETDPSAGTTWRSGTEARGLQDIAVSLQRAEARNVEAQVTAIGTLPIVREARLREVSRELGLRVDEVALQIFTSTLAAGNTETYALPAPNPFVRVGDDPLSTFSLDVDTASYANVRRMLTQGQLPPASAVRIEELLNYFGYDDPAPTGDEPFAVNLEVASCPWNAAHRLVRVGLRGRTVTTAERGPANLVFLLDVSGSMESADKLPLLKASLHLLVKELRDDDRVAIVTYAGEAGLALESTLGRDRDQILAAIDALVASGSTNGGAGIRQAYDLCAAHLAAEGQNRVILATDGDFNVGVTDQNELVGLVREKAQAGIFLTVLGFGTGNLKDSMLERIADDGEGQYAYIDSLREAHKVLVREIGATLEVIAKDVKAQVEFNPATVEAWRLIGYENRLLRHQDFADDRVDAGEIGAGHSLTVLYEILPAGGATDARSAPELIYQQQPIADGELSDAARSGELLTLKLAAKRPSGGESSETRYPLVDAGYALGAADADLRFAAAVACFGLVLGDSPHRAQATLEMALELGAGAIGEDSDGDRAEFLALIGRALALSQD